jgi:hypothetical protein
MTTHNEHERQQRHRNPRASRIAPLLQSFILLKRTCCSSVQMVPYVVRFDTFLHLLGHPIRSEKLADVPLRNPLGSITAGQHH